MEEYIGLDVSMKETAVSIRREGRRVWRGKCASDPNIVAELIRKKAPAAKRVVFETGPLSVWFYHALRAKGVPAICIDARHAKAALDMAANKTDANDADGLAHLAEVGFFREVRVKGFDSMLTRTLVAARTRLVRFTIELSNQIRGIMKTFGLVVPAGKGTTFEKNVRLLLVDHDQLASIVLPMLEAWRGMRIRAAELGRQERNLWQSCALVRCPASSRGASTIAWRPWHCDDAGRFRRANIAVPIDGAPQPILLPGDRLWPLHRSTRCHRRLAACTAGGEHSPARTSFPSDGSSRRRPRRRAPAAFPLHFAGSAETDNTATRVGNDLRRKAMAFVADGRRAHATALSRKSLAAS